MQRAKIRKRLQRPTREQRAEINRKRFEEVCDGYSYTPEPELTGEELREWEAVLCDDLAFWDSLTENNRGIVDYYLNSGYMPDVHRLSRDNYGEYYNNRLKLTHKAYLDYLRRGESVG